MSVLIDPHQREGSAAEYEGAESFLYLRWTPVIAGAIVAAALWSILLTFGSAIGLTVASSSPSWRDASWVLSLLGGLWLLLTSLASSALGAYLAGMLRPAIR